MPPPKTFRRQGLQLEQKLSIMLWDINMEMRKQELEGDKGVYQAGFRQAGVGGAGAV